MESGKCGSCENGFEGEFVRSSITNRTYALCYEDIEEFFPKVVLTS